MLLRMSDAYSRHFSVEGLYCNPSIFWRIFQIVEYTILVQYLFPEIPQETLNMLENFLNQKIVKTLYSSKGYSIWGKLINYFKFPFPFQTIFPDWE